MKVIAVLTKIACLFLLISCSSNDDTTDPVTANPLPTTPTARQIKYLALGDSYTIGQSVCETCRFPFQLKESIANTITANYDLQIIAQTGWTTTNLKNAIAAQNPPNTFDLVTLLIGVNNQYQGKPFSLYQQEFPELVTMATILAKGDKNNVIIVSIPDYAYTPYGEGAGNQAAISAAIDQYNNFARNYAENNGIVFVNITDITREGLNNPALVASDGLHPSELAYAQFVERIVPKALTAIRN
ncbi:MAG: lysophospholipase [Flavobacterium sp. BFFFF1]|uniref:SGNH/GDSL hydrolase family protein n=1 Tax=Flavobacterium sp. BFFFF1 TaxID=2015557 RepID=UPI000BCD32DF|nr:SGNH/GDSL hydrolase family protein [Flavobacterium sp. BFFFF1]OYU81066.1 MAG: lysophospholipase [Flavobacterium sp. BFFFF1]